MCFISNRWFLTITEPNFEFKLVSLIEELLNSKHVYEKVKVLHVIVIQSLVCNAKKYFICMNKYNPHNKRHLCKLSIYKAAKYCLSHLIPCSNYHYIRDKIIWSNIINSPWSELFLSWSAKKRVSRLICRLLLHVT